MIQTQEASQILAAGRLISLLSSRLSPAPPWEGALIGQICFEIIAAPAMSQSLHINETRDQLRDAIVFSTSITGESSTPGYYAWNIVNRAILAPLDSFESVLTPFSNDIAALTLTDHEDPIGAAIVTYSAVSETISLNRNHTLLYPWIAADAALARSLCFPRIIPFLTLSPPKGVSLGAEAIAAAIIQSGQKIVRLADQIQGRWNTLASTGSISQTKVLTRAIALFAQNMILSPNEVARRLHIKKHSARLLCERLHECKALRETTGRSEWRAYGL